MSCEDNSAAVRDRTKALPDGLGCSDSAKMIWAKSILHSSKIDEVSEIEGLWLKNSIGESGCKYRS
jgi:hypothetical protein